jgi:hypothetical protein
MGQCRLTLFLIDIAVNLLLRFVGHLWQLRAAFEPRVASVLPEIAIRWLVVPGTSPVAGQQKCHVVDELRPVRPTAQIDAGW